MTFTHLHTHTPFSFLDGASTIEALVRRAAALGMSRLAITDHDDLSGVVKFSEACVAYGIQPIYGAEVTLEDESHLTLIARDRAGYANLCTLITLAHVAGRDVVRGIVRNLPDQGRVTGVGDEPAGEVGADPLRARLDPHRAA